jgi:hypothetical protein
MPLYKVLYNLPKALIQIANKMGLQKELWNPEVRKIPALALTLQDKVGLCD